MDPLKHWLLKRSLPLWLAHGIDHAAGGFHETLSMDNYICDAPFRRLRVGDPLEPETDVGPLALARAVETLERQIQVGLEAGARILTGGRRRPGPGFFFEPTVLVDIPRGGGFAQEELFGPVAMLFRARDLDDAIAIANDSPFGLGASIWSQDEAEQERAVRELQAGLVFVNGMVISQPALPFGGIKLSGYGRELGAAGIREFCNAKSVWLPGS